MESLILEVIETEKQGMRSEGHTEKESGEPQTETASDSGSVEMSGGSEERRTYTEAATQLPQAQENKRSTARWPS